MFYFGLRSSVLYLRTLAEVRELDTPHHLLSVIGGFAFLHGLAPGCRSLTLVDTDPDALEHWRLVRTLLLAARSLADFVTLLSGWQNSGSFDRAGGLFTAPVDLGARLDSLLEPRLRRLHTRTYGAVVIDPARDEGRIGKARVRFTGYDLSRNTFCWHFGTGNFSGEERFATLQGMVRRLPLRALNARLEEFDYGSQPWQPADQVVFLASNCESPMFTRGDAILHRVLATARADLRYISWLRDFQIAAPEVPTETPAALLESLGGRPAWVLRLAAPGASGGRLESLPGLREERTFSGTREVLDLVAYGQPLLVIDGGRQRDVVALLSAVAPAFLRVLWLHGEPEPWPRLPDGLQRSYRMAVSGSLRAVSFTLRGLHPVL